MKHPLLLIFSSLLIQIQAATFNVTDYGAVADDKTDTHNGWQKLAHDLNDPQNLGTGDIAYWVVLGGVGAVEEFTRNGGAGIRARRIGAEP